MNEIVPRSFVLEIKEYGKIVRTYNDIDYDRFKKVSNGLINDHLTNNIKQGEKEVKNTQFHIYTY